MKRRGRRGDAGDSRSFNNSQIPRWNLSERLLPEEPQGLASLGCCKRSATATHAGEGTNR